MKQHTTYLNQYSLKAGSLRMPEIQLLNSGLTDSIYNQMIIDDGIIECNNIDFETFDSILYNSSNINELKNYLKPKHWIKNNNSIRYIYEHGYVDVFPSVSSSLFKVYGRDTFVSKWMEEYSNLRSIGVVWTNWVYLNADGTMGNMETIVDVPKIYSSAYPWLSLPVDQYIDKYLSARASVLIISGPAGTGKSTLIKAILSKSNENNTTINGYHGSIATISYDESLLSNDAFFTKFMSSQERILVIEDADNFISSRKDGNMLMHRLLNVSDGLVSANHKKIIFTTNLPKNSEIDPALQRPGRCFDIVRSRRLTASESMQLLIDSGKYNGITPLTNSTYSLGELLGDSLISNSQTPSTIGFI